MKNMKLFEEKILGDIYSNSEVLWSYDEWDDIYDENDKIIEDYEIINNIKSYEFELFSEAVEALFSQSDYVLEGIINKWNGSTNVSYHIFGCFDEVLKNLKDTNRFVGYIYKNGVIKIENHHHDGTNYYTLYPLERMNKNYLKDMIKEMKENYFENEKDFKNFCKDIVGKTLSQMNIEDLKDIFIELSE